MIRDVKVDMFVGTPWYGGGILTQTHAGAVHTFRQMVVPNDGVYIKGEGTIRI